MWLRHQIIAALSIGSWIELAAQLSSVQTWMTKLKPALLPPIDMKTRSSLLHSSADSLSTCGSLSPPCGSPAKFFVTEPLQARNATESPDGANPNSGS